jgi:hypothetical protein
MRTFEKNEKIIEYFMSAWPQLVKNRILGEKKTSRVREFWSDVKMIFAVWRRVWNNGGVFDIAGEMQRFFKQQEAFVPAEIERLAPGLLTEIVATYRQHHDSESWQSFTTQKWEIVFPQELWEKVVRVGWNGKPTALPVKVQLKHNGEKVDPYFRDESD